MDYFHYPLMGPFQVKHCAQGLKKLNASLLIYSQVTLAFLLRGRCSRLSPAAIATVFKKRIQQKPLVDLT
jgi:hypothetical protein